MDIQQTGIGLIIISLVFGIVSIFANILIIMAIPTLLVGAYLLAKNDSRKLTKILAEIQEKHDSIESANALQRESVESMTRTVNAISNKFTMDAMMPRR